MKKITNEELIENLKDMYKKLGRIPKKQDLQVNKGSKYCASAYTRAFGGLARALIASGIKPKMIRGLSTKEVIEDLKKIYKLLGRTPTRKDYLEHSYISYGTCTIKNKFYSWTKLLILAGIPVRNAGKVDKEFILEELTKWYKQHNCDVNSLNYWKIRKAKINNKFTFAAETIKNHFPNMSWEEIMRQIDPSYKTKDPFIGRKYYNGKDGKIYLSLLEVEVANYLFKAKQDKLIEDYKYEELVCDRKTWTCDFLIIKDKTNIWLEVDGMRSNRKNPYKNGGNEKINYYKENNMNYRILSYSDKNIIKSLKSIIKEL